MAANNIIQLDFSAVDKRWWLECSLWAQWLYIDTVSRPTENEALSNIHHETLILSQAGGRVELSMRHRQALKLEYQCLSTRPFEESAAKYVADRMHMSVPEVEACLLDAGAIIAAREVLGLPPLVLHTNESKKRKRAA